MHTLDTEALPTSLTIVVLQNLDHNLVLIAKVGQAEVIRDLVETVAEVITRPQN